LSWVAVVCLTAILLSTIIQSNHLCGIRVPDAQAAVELDQASSGSPVCLTCVMAASMSALILLVAFFTMSASSAFVGRMQMRPKPILYSFRLYIRPPPLDLA
jgi:hypothetical protein